MSYSSWSFIDFFVLSLFWDLMNDDIFINNYNLIRLKHKI